MSFLSNYFLYRKATAHPSTTTTPPSSSTPPPTQLPDSTWDIITHEETLAFRTSQITLFLGPFPATALSIPLPSIPPSSTHLTYLATLAPVHRYSHIPSLSVEMVQLYLRSFSMSINALATGAPWLDIIKLAITADCLGDKLVLEGALWALRRKGALACAPGTGVALFLPAHFAYAKEFQRETGAGEMLLRVLREVGGLEYQADISTQLEDLAWVVDVGGRKRAESGTGVRLAGEQRERKILAEDRDAMGPVGWRAWRSGESKQGMGDRMVYPVRQPSVPASVEALRSAARRNFVWSP